MSRKSNVLIVTGEESQKKELEAILYDKYVTEVCSNGKEAFDYLNNHFPDVDLVITAIPLESIDGFELLRLMKISKVLNVVPVLVLIENEDTEDIRKAMGFGAEDIIELPEVSEVIRNRVDTIIRLTRKPDYKNVMEELVIEQIDKYIDKLGICKCPTCLVNYIFYNYLAMLTHSCIINNKYIPLYVKSTFIHKTSPLIIKCKWKLAFIQGTFIHHFF